MESNRPKDKKQAFKSYVLEYNETLQAIIFRIVDTDGMYPCYIQDPDAGLYKITKTNKGNLYMTK